MLVSFGILAYTLIGIFFAELVYAHTGYMDRNINPSQLQKKITYILIVLGWLPLVIIATVTE